MEKRTQSVEEQGPGIIMNEFPPDAFAWRYRQGRCFLNPRVSVWEPHSTSSCCSCIVLGRNMWLPCERESGPAMS